MDKDATMICHKIGDIICLYSAKRTILMEQATYVHKKDKIGLTVA